MTTPETEDRNESNWKRRTVLRTVGASTALPLVGVASARGRGRARGRGGKSRGRGTPSCPDCPERTTRLAKYEYDEERDAFVFEKGACDAVHDFEITNKEGEDHEPILVDFVADILPHSVVVKAGRNCKRFEVGDPEFEVSTDKDSDGFEGRIDLSGQKYAISHFSFCAGVCYQVDLVAGDPIRELGEGGRYRGRLIAAFWGGSLHSTRNTIDQSPYEIEDGCTVSVDGFDATEETAIVTFTVKDDCGPELSLVSYLAPCPPKFDRDMVDQQVLFDYAPANAFETTQAFESGTHELTVALPGLGDLSLLCNDSQ